MPTDPIQPLDLPPVDQPTVSGSCLLAALVSAASTDADDLESAFRRYLTLTAEEIVLQREGAIIMR